MRNKKSQNGEGEKCSCGEKLNIVDLISKSKLPGPDCHQDGLSLSYWENAVILWVIGLHNQRMSLHSRVSC